MVTFTPYSKIFSFQSDFFLNLHIDLKFKNVSQVYEPEIGLKIN